jgi:hypothetical protein
MKPPSASWQRKLQIKSAIIHHVSMNQPQSAASTSCSSFVNGKDDTTTESCSSFIQGKDDTTIEPLSAAERDYGNDNYSRLTFLIEKYNKHNRSCYGKTLRTVTQQIVLSAGTESHHYNPMVCTDECSAYKRTRKVMNRLLEMVELLMTKRQF